MSCETQNVDLVFDNSQNFDLRFDNAQNVDLVFDNSQNIDIACAKLLPDFQYGNSEILKALDPDWMLDTGQSSGSTIPDLTSNSRDFTADGTLSTDFFWRKNFRGIYPYAPGYVELDSGATRSPMGTTFDAEHSLIFPLRGYVGFGTRYFMDTQSDRFAFAGGSAGWGIFESGARYTDYNGGDESEFMLGATYEAGNSVKLYANGLLVEEISPVAAVVEILDSTTWTLGQRFDGSSAINYFYFGGIYKNALLTDDDHYDTWRRLTRLEHHYKTHVEGTSLATGLQRYWPMWETDGAEVMDVSGNANHGAIVGGAILATPPLELGFRTGFRFGSTQYLEWSPSIDLRTDDFSVGFTYQEYLTKTQGIFGTDDTTDYVELGMQASGPVLRVGATTGTTRVGVGTNFDLQETQRFVITYEAGNVCRLYQDGVQTVELDISTLVFSDTSSYTWRLNDGGFASFTGYLEWNRALSASEAAAVWATPTIDTSYPACETRYVASDVSAGEIPDSSGNGNGAAVLEGTSTPTLNGNKIELDQADDQYVRLEAGIASQVASSQAYTYAMAYYCDDGNALWGINNSGGGNLQVMLYSAAAMTYYGPSAQLVTDRNHDRSPGALVISYNRALHQAVIVLNGVLLFQGDVEGSIATFSASDMWSFNNEYDRPTTPSNIGTIDFYECQLWDEALNVEQCLNVSRDLFNTYHRS